MTLDHPHLRAERRCPLCLNDKPVGNLVCWPCFRKNDMRNRTSPQIESVIDKREELLARQEVIDRQLARFFRL